MALRELRSLLTGKGLELKFAAVAGAAANTDITVSGLKTVDKIAAVLELQPPTATSGAAIVADRAAATTIRTDNTIRINADTSGNQLLVVWWSV
jgi:hypothetical protein